MTKNPKSDAETNRKLVEAFNGGTARSTMHEVSSDKIGHIEYTSLLAAAEATRNGLDCLMAVLAQTPGGKQLLPLLGVWFQDYETAIENFNTVSKHHIRKGDYRAR